VATPWPRSWFPLGPAVPVGMFEPSLCLRPNVYEALVRILQKEVHHVATRVMPWLGWLDRVSMSRMFVQMVGLVGKNLAVSFLQSAGTSEPAKPLGRWLR